MSSRIEQIIDEIDEFIESCKFQPLSATKIIVNKEEIEELLRELRLKTPDEIKRYQKIISNKDAILEDAQSKADGIIADAQAKAQELVTQHEIMQKAYAQVIVRGLRAVTDFEYELQMAQTNRVLAPDVDTVFLTTSLEYAYVSSTIMKEVARFGGDLSKFAPPEITTTLRTKLQQVNEKN